MSCGGNLAKTKWHYTGNQTGDLNFVGDYNFVAGGPNGSGISSGILVPKTKIIEISRNLWEYPDSKLSQELLDACFPFIELQWIADITLSDNTVFRVSDRNIYVQDKNKEPRFYQARIEKAPVINVTLGEWLSPNFEIGDLKLDIDNRDGFFNDYLPNGIKYLQWIGAKVSIKVGYGEKISNYYEIFKGFVSNKQGITSTHKAISLKIYDRASEDEVPIPTLTFDNTNYPYVDSEKKGKSLPIIYGDWATEVGDYGEIPGICSNALDPLASSYVWNISENALQEIGDVYLHRGDNVVDKDGPILLLDNAIVKQADLGRVLIPNNIPVLSKISILLDRQSAGIGSGANLLVSESSSLDYVKLGVRPGDVVLKDGDPTKYVITLVTSGTIATSTGTFNQGDNYKLITDKYQFKKGDKLSVFCKGKDLRIMSTTRIADSQILDSNPLSLSIGLRNDYWFVDNDKQKIYNVSFSNEIIKEINFSDIDPSITLISSIDVAFDETLWILEKNQSKIYRYIVSENNVGLSFTTIQVTGIGFLLPNATGISIDDGNVITLFDNTNGNFYRFGAFDPNLTVISTWNRSIFESGAIDIVDISHDVNLNQVIVVDRATNKIYRLNEINGNLISGSDFNLSNINIDYPVGIGYYIDGTLFILNKSDGTIYNFNEFQNCSNNIGFITRDILQKYAGKTTFDFDLLWNETSRNDLAQYKARLHIDEKINAIEKVHKSLLAFNTSAYIRFQKYALFYIHFDNFRTDGGIIREGDIKIDSFNPSKEYNQYFNICSSEYNSLPFSEKTQTSDVYASPSGIKLAGRPIAKSINMEPVYIRTDLDKLVPLFVRLAAAEPEFISMTLGFRFLFIQPNDFFNINFFDLIFGVKSGRRFQNIPAFTRSYQVDLDSMQIKVKLWSLGTTQFGDFVPVGTIAGGENDPIILTNLGTPGYISPIGTILSSTIDTLQLEDVNGNNAEARQSTQVGKAWLAGYKVQIIDASDHSIVEENEILSVSNDVITFVNNFSTSILNTVKNSAGFITSGYYLQYSNYDIVIDDQTRKFSYFTKPLEGYPNSTSQEIEEQRSKLHNFEDKRLPYVLHPKNYVPTT